MLPTFASGGRSPAFSGGTVCVTTADSWAAGVRVSAVLVSRLAAALRGRVCRNALAANQFLPYGDMNVQHSQQKSDGFTLCMACSIAC